ncbi:MAG TPA: glycosyltransferase, partial [Actinomycetota bacterium]|nr:glycosyltransferase [Actinomycetota bacterium]
MRCTYMLPLRWQSDDDIEELTAYLRRVAARAQLIVVDGSSDAIFSAHHAAWTFAEHVRPDADVRCLNGKVAGVVTGLRRAGHEAVVIADDDVRYDEEVLARVCT